MRPRHLAVIVGLLVFVAACASKSAIISRTVSGLDAAHKVFLAEDERQQMQIVALARSQAEGSAMLTEHRAKRDKISAAFIAAYGAVAIAALEPNDLNMSRLATLAIAAWSALKGWQLP